VEWNINELSSLPLTKTWVFQENIPQKEDKTLNEAQEKNEEEK
jgi:hypothetical protein